MIIISQNLRDIRPISRHAEYANDSQWWFGDINDINFYLFNRREDFLNLSIVWLKMNWKCSKARISRITRCHDNFAQFKNFRSIFDLSSNLTNDILILIKESLLSKQVTRWHVFLSYTILMIEFWIKFSQFTSFLGCNFAGKNTWGRFFITLIILKKKPFSLLFTLQVSTLPSQIECKLFESFTWNQPVDQAGWTL